MSSSRTIVCLGKGERPFAGIVSTARALLLTIVWIALIAFITPFPTDENRKGSSAGMCSELTSICISGPIHLWSHPFCNRLIRRGSLWGRDENPTQHDHPADFTCAAVLRDPNGERRTGPGGRGPGSCSSCGLSHP